MPCTLCLIYMMSLNFSSTCITTGGVWIILSCAACWARFVCHNELWPTSLTCPFSSPNRSLGLAGGKYRKLTITSSDLLSKIFSFGLLPLYLIYCYISPHALLFLFDIAVCGPILLRDLVSNISIANWYKVGLQWQGCSPGLSQHMI